MEKHTQMTWQDHAQKFPNGITSWIETHHEIVSAITLAMGTQEQAGSAELHKIREEGGIGAIYTYAEELTDEFEKTHKDEDWDGDFLERIDDFLKSKNIL